MRKERERWFDFLSWNVSRVTIAVALERDVNLPKERDRI